MDKSAIKNFAVEARKILMKSAETEAGFYGVTREGCSSAIHRGADFEVYKTIAGTENRIYGRDIKRRANLVKAVREKGFDQVIEETAYTWFNRIIAIRFMEVNDYLPTRVRVLSSETGSETPDIVTQCLDVDLNMTPEELEKVQKAKDDNKYDDAFCMLFIKQCNELNSVLPGLFEKTDDYMELLLRLSYTSDGVVRMLIDMVDEKNFDINAEGQVEIIGWMYQYYNIEPKAAVFARASGTKMKKEDIPAATQLFTPDWIVRYMVENSVGRIWVEGHPNDSLKNSWNYYVDEAEQEQQVVAKLEEIKATYKGLIPEKIKVIDPCMGSGHILVYAFDVLMQIYESYGYTQRDAACSILQNNIFGLDIDERAYQLAYFAVMMKARQYNRKILTEGMEPNLCFIKSSKSLQDSALDKMGEYKKITQQLIGEFKYAAEYGSVMSVSLSETDLQNISNQLEVVKNNEDIGNILDIMDCNELIATLTPLLKQAKILGQKYEVVITNPPYLSGSAVGSKLNDYLKVNYPASKTDLFAVFIERCAKMLKNNGLQAMITMHAWMFLSSYETLRSKMLATECISMVHLGARAFEEIAGEVVQTTSFILCKNHIPNYKGVYYRLIDGGSQQAKEKMFLAGTNRYTACQSEYERIPGAPMAYWVNQHIFDAFKYGKNISHYIDSFQGIITGDNNKFLRFWHELDNHKITFDATKMDSVNLNTQYWIPYNKGGEFRKWYGNQDYVVNWKNGPNDKTRGKKSFESYYLREYVSWSYIAMGTLACRYFPNGFLWDVAGSGIFDKKDYLYYLQAFISSKVGIEILNIINPTINYQVENILQLPIIESEHKNTIDSIVKENIKEAKKDWDAFEISWNFRKHPLVPTQQEWKEQLSSQFTTTREEAFSKLSWHYQNWEQDCEYRFNQLKENEEELNRIFIEIYGLQDELTPDVAEKDVTVCKADLQRDIKSLLSYAVGCMFGRYSHDDEGVVYAGGKWDSSKYNTFIPDKDNCIPITDEEYFEDDIVGLFCKWLKTVYGEEKLEENLDFIANALGNKGNTSREIIRNYFLNDFIKDHIKIYQKRPIYWLFDSGKQNGFKALIYMHRYDKDTLNMIRSEYLHKAENAVENSLQNVEYIIQTSASAVERAKATKDRDKYVKQLNEMRVYYQALSHLALQKIEIDLDDGVKHNYQLFQGIEVITDGGKKQKVDLLTKI